MQSPNTVRIGIQKRDGHMFGASQTMFQQWWGINIPTPKPKRFFGALSLNAGKFLRSWVSIGRPANSNKPKNKSLENVAIPYGENRQIDATILMCRIEDIVSNLADGILQIGIVSSDVLSEWEAANGELVKRNPGIKQVDVGPAGSRLMIGIAKDFMASDRFTTWQEAVIYCHKNQKPIYTSYKGDLEKFLEDNNLPIPPIRVRRGTVEAQAKLDDAVIIADLVESGKSMRDNGYEPIVEIGESRTLVLANIEGADARAGIVRSLMARVSGQKILKAA